MVRAATTVSLTTNLGGTLTNDINLSTKEELPNITAGS